MSAVHVIVGASVGSVSQKCVVVRRRARISSAKTLVSPSVRLKDLLGHVTRVKMKKRRVHVIVGAGAGAAFEF